MAYVRTLRRDDGPFFPRYVSRLSGYRDVLGAAGDEIAVTDPDSQFYGWSTNQINAYWAAQGVAVLTPSLAAKGVIWPGDTVVSYSEADVQSAMDEAAAFALTDPAVSAALAQLGTPGSAGIVTQRGIDAANAAAAAAAAHDDAALLAAAKAAIADEIASGGLFTDTLPAGAIYDESELVGMISSDQAIADYINVAHGGQPTNAIAARGKLPPNITPAPPVVDPATTPAPGVVAKGVIDAVTGAATGNPAGVAAGMIEVLTGGGTHAVVIDPVTGEPVVNTDPTNAGSSGTWGGVPSWLPLAGAGVLAFFLLQRH
jgi:hypothetical protein